MIKYRECSFVKSAKHSVIHLPPTSLYEAFHINKKLLNGAPAIAIPLPNADVIKEHLKSEIPEYLKMQRAPRNVKVLL